MKKEKNTIKKEEVTVGIKLFNVWLGFSLIETVFIFISIILYSYSVLGGPIYPFVFFFLLIPVVFSVTIYRTLIFEQKKDKKFVGYAVVSIFLTGTCMATSWFFMAISFLTLNAGSFFWMIIFPCTVLIVVPIVWVFYLLSSQKIKDTFVN